MPERANRTHVVPGNIMSVEFKLFDFMTLKQFLYLVVASFLSYVFITILPDGIFKILIPGVLIVSGIIIAFVQFNGEPFEVYTTNFLLGVIQPQRRVWSKSPMPSKPVTIPSDSAVTQKALQSIADNFVQEEEVIPVNYNKIQNEIDDQEQKFLKANSPEDIKYKVNSSKADLSKLNFDFSALNTDKKITDKTVMPTPSQSANITGNSNFQNIKNTTNLDVNTNNMIMKQDNNVNNVSNSKGPFTINMDDDDSAKKNNNDSIDLNLTGANTPSQATTYSDHSDHELETDTSVLNIHHDSATYPVAQTEENVLDLRNEVYTPDLGVDTLPEISNSVNYFNPPVKTQDLNDPNYGKIHGKVISATTAPLAQLSITMFDEGGNAIESIITNKDGEFVFNSLPKVFEIRVFSDKKFLFSPIDKESKKIEIHEIPEDENESVYSSIYRKQVSNADLYERLSNASEMDSSDTKIPNTINGMVKDKEGHYLVGVLVSINNEHGTTIRALATNPLGQFFSLSPLPNGKYSIILEKDGHTFKPYEITLEGQIYPSKIIIAD